eukprot:s896_g16.t1
MVVGDAPVPPCTPCYQPLDAPELDREVTRFALPPAMTPEPSDDLGFYNFSWEGPVHLHATESNEITEGKGKIGSLLFKAVMTLINEGQKVKDSEVGLPKEQPQRPRLQPSDPPFTPEEIPEFSLPQAQDKDFDLFSDLDMVRPRHSCQALEADREVACNSNQVVKPGQTILDMLSNHQDQKIMSLSPYLEKSEEQRRRTSTCSTCVTLAEAPRASPRPKLLEAPNPHGITGRA